MATKNTSRTGKKNSASKKRNAARPQNRSLLPVALIAAAAVVLAFFFQYVWYPVGQATTAASVNTVLEVAPVGSVRLNEVMTSNKKAWQDGEGNYPDWIELINTSGEPQDITGWILMDDMNKNLGFTFPQTILEPGECVVVYATNNLRTTPGYEFQAPFKLSASGDSVLLFDASGNLRESINVPALSANHVYMRDPGTGEWTTSAYYTPGLPNTQENHYALTEVRTAESSALVINEVMPDNATYIPDEDGEYVDWIEIRNTSGSDVSLNGYGLSDDESRPGKWRFPDVTIKSGEVLVIYASGKDRKPADGSNLHANFRLSAEGESVVLSNAAGLVLDRMKFENVKADVSVSRTEDGSFSSGYPPTPGRVNSRESAAALDETYMASNASRLYITEAMASARQAEASSSESDWMELYNASGSDINLSGYGLSNNPKRPRKWQFPEGSVIRAGQYLRVALSGLNTGDTQKMQMHTNFSLSLADSSALTLCTPDGTIIDRMPLTGQIASVSYGRPEGKSGFYFFSAATPAAANTGAAYQGRASNVEFSKGGGWFEDESFAVTLNASEGATIRYTTDCTDPNENSPIYEGPIAITGTTIIRARAFSEGMLPSLIGTQSYLFGERHTMPVISLVSDPEGLFSHERGIMERGPNALKDYPWGSSNKGANFWMDWTRAGNVEFFDVDGATILSQGAGLALQGAYSRAQRQKAFSVTARNVYGENRFYAELFPNRDYTEYKSFILRGSGQDGPRTRMLDSILTSMAEGTGVMYQDTRLVIVYLNGEYYGHLNMRERINKYSIAQYEGWTDVDKIDLIKANDIEMKGSNQTFAEMLTWLKANGCKTEENLQRVAGIVDIDNYLNYVAIQMIIGNTDTLNVKRYRSTEGDGKWRWILFDLDWAMNTDTNSFRRWLDPTGMGNGKRTNNTLFVELMKNEGVRDRFMTILGDLMARNYDSDRILAAMEQRYQQLLPEMPAHQERWGFTMKEWQNYLNQYKKYIQQRPAKLLGYIRETTGMSAEEMRKYFSVTMDKYALG